MRNSLYRCSLTISCVSSKDLSSLNFKEPDNLPMCKRKKSNIASISIWMQVKSRKKLESRATAQSDIYCSTAQNMYFISLQHKWQVWGSVQQSVTFGWKPMQICHCYDCILCRQISCGLFDFNTRASVCHCHWDHTKPKTSAELFLLFL